MRRIRVYPSIEELVHLAENYNVNVILNTEYPYLYPTNEEAAVECDLMGVGLLPSKEVAHGWLHGDKTDLDQWINAYRNQDWMNVHEDGFVTYHV